MADNKLDNDFLILAVSKSLDEWIMDTITPVIIIIDEIMKQLISGFGGFDRYVR